jgi:hypothetical protein
LCFVSNFGFYRHKVVGVFITVAPLLYTYFNRRTLLENGNASVLLNAVNAPSVLSP